MQSIAALTGLPGPFGTMRPRHRRARGRRFRRAVAAWPAALVRPSPVAPRQALVTCNGRTLRAAVGRGGFAALKREGDGASPRVRLRPVALLTRGPPRGWLPARRVRSCDAWCDDPASAHYNRGGRPSAHASHEALLRPDDLYDRVMITDYNQRPRVRGAGSAIFIHVARPGLTPTEGCVAFAAADWRRSVVPLGPYLVAIDPRPVR